MWYVCDKFYAKLDKKKLTTGKSIIKNIVKYNEAAGLSAF